MRKSTIDKSKVSAHTLRFRASTGPVIPMRSLASVGGRTRRAMRKGRGGGLRYHIAPTAMLPPWMAASFTAFAAAASVVLARFGRRKVLGK